MKTIPFETLVAKNIMRHNLTLATAESCTGGLISHLLTNVSGSSSFFLGGVVAYSNDLKIKLVGVPVETIIQHGAVSEPVAAALAEGIRARTEADLGISVTGIAGPTGGTPEKPVGTTYIGLAAAGGTWVHHYQWDGDREAVKRQSAQAALQIILDHIRKLDSLSG